MTSSLVGSEMCIRDSVCLDAKSVVMLPHASGKRKSLCGDRAIEPRAAGSCLLYTSDAADDM
eukprot:5804627-Prorocentrum_lima.AAC.1